MPARIRRLPVDERGFPIPYFVAVLGGKPDFRVVGPGKMRRALRAELCWICGDRLGAHKAFVIGPMCAINRVISEPPSHRDCAIFAATHCPFLTRPMARRRDAGLPGAIVDAPGFAIARNPGACCVWSTRSFRPFRPHAGGEGVLFALGAPTEVLWFANGRAATREEVLCSVDTGLPSLREMARRDGDERELERAIATFMQLVPA